MNRLLFTKISALIGLVLGLVSAHNIGVIIITEYIGYSLPFLVIGAVIGIVLDGIQTLSTLNRQPKGTQNQGSNDGLAVKPNPSEPKKTDIRFALAMFIACVFGGLFVTGWVKVVVGLGVAPLETIAGQIGVALVPFVVGWLIAKVLGLALKQVSFNTLWVASTTLLIVLMFVGQNKSETSVATSHDTTAPSAEKTSVTSANTIPFETAVCREAFNEGQWSRAFPVCSTAAQQGDTKAQWSLGVMYEYGRGVVQDSKEALRWYIQAAELGDVLAQYEVGRHHQMGQGVMPDPIRALMWYMLAANGGNTYAANIRDAVAERMRPDQIAEAQFMARNCKAMNYKGC